MHMLKRFEIDNFMSYKNNTRIELEKTNYQVLADTNVKKNILKGLLFVGANASGKSNAMLALKFLLDFLFGKVEMNLDSHICLFSTNPIMALEYTFDIDNSEIIYRIEYQRVDKKIKEDLYVDGENVFTRDGSVAKVKITDEVNYADVPGNTLFLRDIYFNTKFRGRESLQKWFVFLSNSVYVDLYSEEVIPYGKKDLSLKTYLDENGTGDINEFFNKYKFNQTIEYDKRAEGKLITIESPKKNIFFKRKGIEEPIPFVLESLGNRNLIQLLPAFFHCINEGGLLLLDEFSSGFHNDLEELLIKYFMRNAEGAQLVFVSHSTNLLSNSILRPDQIYSVDFGKEGSIIKRFSSEKPREAQNLEKMYLGGVFNGVPQYEHTIK